MPLYFGSNEQYIVNFNGSQLRAIMVMSDVPVVPPAVYDDTWPIQWNSLAIANSGGASFEAEGLTIYKISNLTPTAAELATVRLNGMSSMATDDGYEGINFAVSDSYVVDDNNYCVMLKEETETFKYWQCILYSIGEVSGESASAGFTETGLWFVGYFSSYQDYFADCDFTLSLAQSEVYDVKQEDDTLYIKNAKATLNGTTLEMT